MEKPGPTYLHIVTNMLVIITNNVIKLVLLTLITLFQITQINDTYCTAISGTWYDL